MKLRWFTTYDSNGVDSPTTLQYWSKDMKRWLDVHHVRVREDKKEEYLTDESAHWD